MTIIVEVQYMIDYIGSFIIPTIFILVGYFFWKHPPKEINSTSGWRTAQSEQNQETWDFANTLGGKCFLILGCIEFLCTLILIVIALNLGVINVLFDKITVPVLVIIQTICLVIVIVYVEGKLRKYFKH